MADEFDRQMESLKTNQQRKTAGSPQEAARQLSALKSELESSDAAKNANVAVESARDGLRITLKGQPIGEWRVHSSGLALYRPGSTSADTHATTVSEAVKMTARLVAAAGQA